MSFGLYSLTVVMVISFFMLNDSSVLEKHI